MYYRINKLIFIQFVLRKERFIIRNGIILESVVFAFLLEACYFCINILRVAMNLPAVSV